MESKLLECVLSPMGDDGEKTIQACCGRGIHCIPKRG